MVATKPRNADLYCRVSDARNGDHRNVDDQEQRLRTRAAELGWGIHRVIVENDTSAFKRRKVTLPDGTRAMRVVRPGWRSIIDDLARGRADGLLALDLDRACRDPRDLEDLIDVVEGYNPRLPVQSITGSLSLATDSDVTTARIMVAIANKESRDKRRRVADERLRQAQQGRNGGGPRKFGFEPDGVTVRPSERAEIVKAVEAVLAGASLRSICQGLRARGVPTVRGAQWQPRTLKAILLAPRIAGLVVYQGDVLEGVQAPWEPLVPRQQWEAVTQILGDEDRNTSPGPAPRWLMSGLARCGHPDCIDLDPARTMRVGTSGRNQAPCYKCSGPKSHCARSAPTLDEYIGMIVTKRLARPDAVDLLAPTGPSIDAAALATEANALRQRITGAKDLWESGVFTDAELRTRVQRMQTQLGEITQRLISAAGTDPLVGIAGNPNAARIWKRLELARKRAIVDTLVVVTVHPQPRGRQPGGGYFNPDYIDVQPRRP
jgi:DNA invertase Pin-like site-specific DNA recombinase